MTAALGKTLTKYLTLFLCLTTVALAGCASGGFKLTRSYAQFVNKQNILIRIILYILTLPVFAVTMLIDMVIFNTVDFWEGRVSAGDFQFAEGEKTFHVKHEILPEKGLRKSSITVLNQDNLLLQTVVLAETPQGEIELFVDGVLRTKVQDVAGLPFASIYSANGKFMEEKMLLVEGALSIVAKEGSR